MGRLGAGEGLGIAQRVGEKPGAREPPGNPHKQEHLDPEDENPSIPFQRQSSGSPGEEIRGSGPSEPRRKSIPSPFK